MKANVKYSQNSLETVGKTMHFTCQEVMSQSTIIMHLYAMKAAQSIGKITKKH